MTSDIIVYRPHSPSLMPASTDAELSSILSLKWFLLSSVGTMTSAFRSLDYCCNLELLSVLGTMTLLREISLQVLDCSHR